MNFIYSINFTPLENDETINIQPVQIKCPESKMEVDCRMNVVYIHTHDTGRYIQPYGYNVPTRNLMRKAEEGTLFRNAFSMAPTCSPSRAAMLTGMASHSCGMYGLAHLGYSLNNPDQHIVNYLNQNGYETVLAGHQHEFSWEGELPYKKVFCKFDPRNTDWINMDIAAAKAAADYIKSNNHRKFFLSFGMMSTHRPYPAHGDDVNPGVVRAPYTVPDTKETREDMAGFINMAMVADECTGIVLDAIKDAGIENDTVVLFTTDHGINFPGMKCFLYDGGIEVSLIMMCPGSRRKGEAVDSLVSQIDIFPTLCDYLGLEKPNWLQGRSLKPIIEGQAEEINSEIFAEQTYHTAYEPTRCVRTSRYKLIRHFRDHRKSVSMYGGKNDIEILEYDPSDDVGFKYYNNIREMDMLFDLYLDPTESVNVAGDIRYSEVYKQLSESLEKWMKDTDDPLLKGEIKPPKGALYVSEENFVKGSFSLDIAE